VQVERICAHDITPQKFQEEYINRYGTIADFWWWMRFASLAQQGGRGKRGRVVVNMEVGGRTLSWVSCQGGSALVDVVLTQQQPNRGMPVVLTGLMDEWPAWKEGSGRKWTFDFFKEKYGETQCTIDTEGCKEHMPLAEYREIRHLRHISAASHLDETRLTSPPAFFLRISVQVPRLQCSAPRLPHPLPPHMVL